MRKHSNRPTMPTGHLHVQMIQNQGADLEKNKMDALIQLVTKSVEGGANTLITVPQPKSDDLKGVLNHKPKM